MNVVLYKPEIPPNTGNIGRLCVNTDSILHIVGGASFDFSEKSVRRAGLDYWEYLKIHFHTNWEEFLKFIDSGSAIYYVSKFGSKIYSNIKYPNNPYLVFGNETKGLPPEILSKAEIDKIVKIPMGENSRSINLSNAVAIVLYEALRQTRNWKE
ncbi:MAG: tRNA (cytidine(34)-2'-O)-methyltransferase [Leptospiraceae bacterium]|nr:tRNA (cytidine(34)-2'-O)-methyltransferase [Leptospiraceae bacterium]MCK6382396.1 tRNA (cytidine(34)-2'-O)-methyltransferase [Leptospiraceae bacterium]NUM41843.1 tRNA (cytidine(34)-2'-O)-methyltransferase [Leptospiraceae bacterium]